MTDKQKLNLGFLAGLVCVLLVIALVYEHEIREFINPEVPSEQAQKILLMLDNSDNWDFGLDGIRSKGTPKIWIRVRGVIRCKVNIDSYTEVPLSRHDLYFIEQKAIEVEGNIMVRELRKTK